MWTNYNLGGIGDGGANSSTFALTNSIPYWIVPPHGPLAAYRLGSSIYVSKWNLRGGFHFSLQPTTNPLYAFEYQQPYQVRVLIVRDNTPQNSNAGTSYTPKYADICDVTLGNTATWCSAFYRQDQGGRYSVLYDKVTNIKMLRDVYGTFTQTLNWTPTVLNGVDIIKRFGMRRVRGNVKNQKLANDNTKNMSGQLYMIITRNMPSNIALEWNARGRLWFYDSSPPN